MFIASKKELSVLKREFQSEHKTVVLVCGKRRKDMTSLNVNTIGIQ